VSERALTRRIRAAALAAGLLVAGVVPATLLGCGAGTAGGSQPGSAPASPTVSRPTVLPSASASASPPPPASAAAPSGSLAAVATASVPAAPTRPLAGRIVTVDPGHNGGNFEHPRAISRLVPDGAGEKECDTTGTAAPDGYREADFNWSVALGLRSLLTQAGARVVMTRASNGGVGPCVNERAAIGNRAHSDAAISIHADGGPPSGSGFAILVPAPIPSRSDSSILAPSRLLGTDLRSALIGIGLHTSTYDGSHGIAPRTDLGGLNLSRVPKVFVEVANMQNRADEAPMERAGYRARVARALLAGLERFLSPP
jgi:N-acetylmuramoyl-L-alanine amidase